MLAGELLAIAEDMIRDYDELDVIPTMQSAVNLAINRGNLSNQQFRLEVEEIKSAAKRISDRSTSRNYSIELKRRLSNSSFSQTLPDALARILLVGLKDRKDDGGHISSSELNIYLQEAVKFYNKMQNLVEASAAFGVERYVTPAGFVSIEIHLPDRVYRRELDELAERLTRFGHLLAVLGELASGSREDVRVHWIATSDLVVAVSVGSVSVGCILYAYGQFLSVVEKHLSIAKMLKDLKGSGAGTETVEASLRANEAQSLEAAVAVVVSRFGEKLPEDRRNELKIELKLTAEAVIPDLAAGARLRLDPRDQKKFSEDGLPDERDDFELSREQVEVREALEVRLDALLDNGGRDALGLISVDKDDGILPR